MTVEIYSLMVLVGIVTRRVGIVGLVVGEKFLAQLVPARLPNIVAE